MDDEQDVAEALILTIDEAERLVRATESAAHCF